ncbi:lipopolysaccharide assembly protein LapA domain-containing protein [Mariniflexile aquimaris]|uniref:Lipopolysaccharide assembly protein LapA domain-containing protein n=1 Tax=Mariniflexile aquimaris TaxID=881009 RepID=A0ABW3BPJ3_9FLAO
MKLKTILALVFAAIIVVFSIQNARVIEISFLFWKLAASTVLVILGSFIIGILVGVLLSLKRKTKSKTLL